MRAAFVADVTCPFCHVAHQNLIEAVGPDNIDWTPMLLDPDGVDADLHWTEYLTRRLGEESVWRPLLDEATESALEYGVVLRWDRLTVHPDSRDSHRLILWAGLESDRLQHDVASAVMRAHWEEGRDIGDPRVLTDIALDAGMDASKLMQRLRSQEAVQKVLAASRAAREAGVTEVPTVVVSGTLLRGTRAPSEYWAFLQGRSDAA